jgi:hypothetical protein
MTRTEILTRYRRLRQVSKEHHLAVLDIIAPDVLMDWAKRLDLTQGRTLVLESEHEMTLAEDLATYLAKPGRSHPLDRYAQAARFASGSDEAIVLEAMRDPCFSLWRVERRHETAGLILRDLLRGGETWLVDETLEKTARPGLETALPPRHSHPRWRKHLWRDGVFLALIRAARAPFCAAAVPLAAADFPVRLGGHGV